MISELPKCKCGGKLLREKEFTKLFLKYGYTVDEKWYICKCVLCGLETQVCWVRDEEVF